MNKLVLALACVGTLFLVSSCDGKTEQAQQETFEARDSLVTAMAERDSIMSLMVDINTGMAQIKEMEKMISNTSLGSESSDSRAQIKNDMILIQTTLKERRERLDALERQLKNSKNYSAEMKKSIEALKEQIQGQENTIVDLQSQLKKANIVIQDLNVKVDSLNVAKETVAKEKEAAEMRSEQLVNEMNVCYYVVGSSSELKENKIIESGFLRKTKVLESDFNKNYFTKADRRTLVEIPLHSKKAKLQSKHPEGSYEIVDNGGIKSIKILNSAKFWELSNYLVVEI